MNSQFTVFDTCNQPTVPRLHSPSFPTQVKYALQEYACTAIDMVARRTRLAFLNVQAANEALPKIVDIMGAELGWSKAAKKVGATVCLSVCEQLQALLLPAFFSFLCTK